MARALETLSRDADLMAKVGGVAAMDDALEELAEGLLTLGWPIRDIVVWLNRLTSAEVNRAITTPGWMPQRPTSGAGETTGTGSSSTLLIVGGVAVAAVVVFLVVRR